MKPAALVLIGVIVGASLGTGAVYFIIFSNMVKPQMEELSQRISEVEGSITTLADRQALERDRLSRAEELIARAREESISSMDDLTDRIASIESSIIGLDVLSQSISKVEGSITSIESDINEIYIQLSSLQESLYNGFSSDIANLQEDIATLETNVTELVSEVDEMVMDLKEDLAYELLKKALAEPGGYVTSRITDELFEELQSSNDKFLQWIISAGSENVKNSLWIVVDSKVPTLTWHDQNIKKITINRYRTYVITYFSITLDTGLPSIGEIKVSRVSLIISGMVNVSTKKTSSIEVYSLNL